MIAVCISGGNARRFDSTRNTQTSKTIVINCFNFSRFMDPLHRIYSFKKKHPRRFSRTPDNVNYLLDVLIIQYYNII